MLEFTVVNSRKLHVVTICLAHGHLRTIYSKQNSLHLWFHFFCLQHSILRPPNQYTASDIKLTIATQCAKRHASASHKASFKSGKIQRYILRVHELGCSFHDFESLGAIGPVDKQKSAEPAGPAECTGTQQLPLEKGRGARRIYYHHSCTQPQKSSQNKARNIAATHIHNNVQTCEISPFICIPGTRK